MENVFLHSFIRTDPPFSLTQQASLAWLAKLHNANKENDSGISDEMMQKRFHHYGVKQTKIEKKYYACSDMLLDNLKEGAVFSPETIGDQKYKTEFFRDFTENYFKELYQKQTSLPDHMIHVSCTGYVSPSAPQRIASIRKTPVNITHAYHMGCYAALPAVRMAKAFVQSQESQTVDVIHTELCSLHANSKVHTPEQIVIQSLFADGLIKYSLSPKKSSVEKAFRVIAIQEAIVENSLEDMKWEPEHFGFQMSLSRQVPEKIALHLPSALENFAKKVGINQKDLMKHAIFAIHPGGPRIIEMVAEKLCLKESQIASSQKILKERGNMSSATLPHIWQDLMDTDQLLSSDLVVSLAFGPGLSIFASLFEYKKAL